MAKKRKRTGRTPEGVDAAERSRWIDEQLERRWRALKSSRGVAADADPYEARTTLLNDRLAGLDR